jgi:pimeloyl-ACP methyl ester carboxylesterase
MIASLSPCDVAEARAMPRACANGIEIEYEEFGNAGDEPVLLIMGLGAQMILWDDAFCESLAGRGYRVIRFDNRDVGLSTCSTISARPIYSLSSVRGCSVGRSMPRIS